MPCTLFSMCGRFSVNYLKVRLLQTFLYSPFAAGRTQVLRISPKITKLKYSCWIDLGFPFFFFLPDCLCLILSSLHLLCFSLVVSVSSCLGFLPDYILQKQFLRSCCHLGWSGHLANPSIWEEKAEGLKVQGSLTLQREFKASFGNLVRPCLNPRKGLG